MQQPPAITNFDQWRRAARPLLTSGAPPATIDWNAIGSASETAGARAGTRASEATALPETTLRISALLLKLLEAVSMYRHPGRWELMYRLVWRTLNGTPQLLEDAADADVRHATLMQRAVNRDVHKMHAFVRFRETLSEEGATAYVAWFEPQHEILRRGAAFFVKRFANMDWTIATPDGAAVWRSRELSFIDAPHTDRRPRADAFEGLWRTYYRSICNLARINPSAMQREMPKHYWNNLPEAVDIDGLIRTGARRFMQIESASSHEDIRMADDALPKVCMPKGIARALPQPRISGEDPQTCRRCDLWKHATQAVVGEGDPGARVMLVGEQPGDEEDLRGHPFVGPAGRELDAALSAAGLERRRLFITNAVKHFKWEPRGKRRLHKKPGTGEISACSIWLGEEIVAVKPAVIVALGASALRALTGRTLTIDAARNSDLEHPSGAKILATYHPSAILRAEGDRAGELRDTLIADLRQAATLQ